MQRSRNGERPKMEESFGLWCHVPGAETLTQGIEPSLLCCTWRTVAKVSVLSAVKHPGTRWRMAASSSTFPGMSVGPHSRQLLIFQHHLQIKVQNHGWQLRHTLDSWICPVLRHTASSTESCFAPSSRSSSRGSRRLREEGWW